jgi:hypothetical protein
MLFSHVLLLGAMICAFPWQATKATCESSPLIRATPPPDPSADSFGEGPWYVSADRTIWAGWMADRWIVGRNKVLWVRPAGTELTIKGDRIDGLSARLTAQIPCCYRFGFQATTVTFPTAGCWRVTATAGEHTLTFVTSVSATKPSR